LLRHASSTAHDDEAVLLTLIERHVDAPRGAIGRKLAHRVNIDDRLDSSATPIEAQQPTAAVARKRCRVAGARRQRQQLIAPLDALCANLHRHVARRHVAAAAAIRNTNGVQKESCTFDVQIQCQPLRCVCVCVDKTSVHHQQQNNITARARTCGATVE
jgi:hypothetical protein